MSERITEIILKDVLDGIEYFYGKDGVDQVANFALLKNKSRESNQFMDKLEKAYGLSPAPQGSETPHE